MCLRTWQNHPQIIIIIIKTMNRLVRRGVCWYVTDSVTGVRANPSPASGTRPRPRPLASLGSCGPYRTLADYATFKPDARARQNKTDQASRYSLPGDRLRVIEIYHRAWRRTITIPPPLDQSPIDFLWRDGWRWQYYTGRCILYTAPTVL